eukprot:gene6648-7348_t
MVVIDGDFIGCCSHEKARQQAIDQLGPSACGATAIYTALVMLGIVNPTILPTLDWSLVILRKRAEAAPLPQYLLSRFNAGCTGEELVQSMSLILDHAHITDLLEDGYFQPYETLDNKPIDLVDYLEKKFIEGYVIIATLNLQVLGNDAWHHQIVYGIDRLKRLLYCTNPIGPYPVELVEQMLSTPSVLLISREDVLKRLDRPEGNTTIYSLPEWGPFNVPKQIEKILADSSEPFVVIPAAYQAGFAFFRRRQAPIEPA